MTTDELKEQATKRLELDRGDDSRSGMETKSIRMETRALPGVDGWATHIDNLTRAYHAELRHCSSKLARVMAHLKWKTEFERLRNLPLNQKTPLGYAAEQQVRALAALSPLPGVGFDSQNFIARLNSQAISLSVDDADRIVIRGRCSEQIRRQIAANKSSLLTFLKNPQEIRV